MTSIDNSGFLNVCGNCDCPGFVPAVSWSYNAGTKALTITDASTFPTGNGMLALNVTASDGAGHTRTGRITAAGGAVVLDLSAGGLVLGPNGFNIAATVITVHRCVADLSAFNLGVAANGSGSLGNTLAEGDIDGSLT